MDSILLPELECKEFRMELPTQLLAAVTHFEYGIFNVALPNVIAILLLIAVFFGAAWLRLPHVFESAPHERKQK